jgi:hypothetical protein
LNLYLSFRWTHKAWPPHPSLQYARFRPCTCPPRRTGRSSTVPGRGGRSSRPRSPPPCTCCAADRGRRSRRPRSPPPCTCCAAGRGCRSSRPRSPPPCSTCAPGRGRRCLHRRIPCSSTVAARAGTSLPPLASHLSSASAQRAVRSSLVRGRSLLARTIRRSRPLLVLCTGVDQMAPRPPSACRCAS